MFLFFSFPPLVVFSPHPHLFSPTSPDNPTLPQSDDVKKRKRIKTENRSLSLTYRQSPVERLGVFPEESHLFPSLAPSKQPSPPSTYLLPHRWPFFFLRFFSQTENLPLFSLMKHTLCTLGCTVEEPGRSGNSHFSTGIGAGGTSLAPPSANTESSAPPPPPSSNPLVFP